VEDESQKRQRFLGSRVPPSLFGIALGMAGLAEAWHAAGPLLGTAQAIPSALNILDAALWLVLVGAYVAQGPRVILADLRDPVLSPFVSASVITAMLLSAALAADAFAAGRVLVIVCLAMTISLGGWLTGQWMTGGIDPDSLHAGYFLPTAAGGLIGADAAAQVQLHALAQASFGIGVISWIPARLDDLEPAVHPSRAAFRAGADEGDRTRHTRGRGVGVFRPGGPDRELRGLHAGRVRGPHGSGPAPADPGLPQASVHTRSMVLHLCLHGGPRRPRGSVTNGEALAAAGDLAFL
jgi:voltage-gated anion channel